MTQDQNPTGQNKQDGRTIAGEIPPDELDRARQGQRGLHDKSLNTGDHINDSSGARHEGVPPTPFAASGRLEKGRILTIAIIIGALVLMAFVLTMCVFSAPTAPVEDNPYDILQQKVDRAFDNDTGVDYNRNAAPVDLPGGQAQDRDQGQGVPPQPQQQQPQQQQQQDPQQRQMELMRQREEMLEQQREAVPSPLPETPPAPVPLGGDNY